MDDFASAQSEDLGRSVKPKRAWLDARGGLGLVRGTVDVDEPNGSKMAELLAHQSVIMGYAKEKGYALIVSGPASAHVGVDQVGEHMADTVQLTHPVPVIETKTTIAYELGRWFVRLTEVGIAGVVIFLLLRRSKRRS
jgi:hypothetical protein